MSKADLGSAHEAVLDALRGARRAADAVQCRILASIDARITKKVPRVVLVVDDEIALLRAISRLVKARIDGIEVEMAASLSDARTLLASKRVLPGVVLLDLNLHGEVGWDLAAELPHDVRVILMSGSVDRARLSALAEKIDVRWVEKGDNGEAIIREIRLALGDPPDSAP